jgi:FkbM family methyltransferase
LKATVALKQLSIATGLYRPARWCSRQIYATQRQSYREDVELYRALLPRDAVCFDVGANTGAKSEAMLRAGVKRVVAFEPNPEVIPELRARCAGWQNWTLVQAALGSAPGFARLYARELNGQSGLLETWEASSPIIATSDVPVLTLDAAIQHFGRPFYCKIDVEGWEREVLCGLSESLPLVSFEFHLIQSNIPQTLACLRRLRHLGTGEVNITPAEAATLHFERWQPLERFLEWYPGDLRETLPRDIYGDIFVRRTKS